MSETGWRLGVFLAAIVLLSAWQVLAPRRSSIGQKIWRRWFDHLSMTTIAWLVMRGLLPMTAVGVAYYVSLFDAHPLNGYIVVPVGVLLLDCAIYWQHRFSHQWRWLWRFHRVHHTDGHFDTSTALRFHPVELLLSMACKCVLVVMFAIPPPAVLLFEILLSTSALFNHSNIRLPADSWIRLFVVTPDMHRTHHSCIEAEMGSNFGFFFPWWDRLFRSYTKVPSLPTITMPLGLPKGEFQQLRLKDLLLLPFKRMN